MTTSGYPDGGKTRPQLLRYGEMQSITASALIHCIIPPNVQQRAVVITAIFVLPLCWTIVLDHIAVLISSRRLCQTRSGEAEAGVVLSLSRILAKRPAFSHRCTVAFQPLSPSCSRPGSCYFYLFGPSHDNRPADRVQMQVPVELHVTVRVGG